jgi:adenosylmethionine-8-amino-7-oxononanoate aminotransferase
MAPTAIAESLLFNAETNDFSVKKEVFGNGLINSQVNSKDISIADTPNGFQMERHMKRAFPVVIGGKGNYLHLSDGRKILDATSGAAVSCLGHGDQRVIEAITRQLSSGTPYLCSSYWSSDVAQELCKELIDGTDQKMSRVYLSGSGQLEYRKRPSIFEQ